MKYEFLDIFKIKRIFERNFKNKQHKNYTFVFSYLVSKLQDLVADRSIPTKAECCRVCFNQLKKHSLRSYFL